MRRRRRTAVLLGVAILVWTGCGNAPRILSPYGSGEAVSPNVDGTPRQRPTSHNGVDIAAGDVGDRILAAAPGRVVSIETDPWVGVTIALVHDQFSRDADSQGAAYVTTYSHLKDASVHVGEIVERGQTIGHIGMFWESGNVVHLHWMLCRSRCELGADLDPMKKFVGCLSRDHAYSTAYLELTSPVPC